MFKYTGLTVSSISQGGDLYGVRITGRSDFNTFLSVSGSLVITNSSKPQLLNGTYQVKTVSGTFVDITNNSGEGWDVNNHYATTATTAKPFGWVAGPIDGFLPTDSNTDAYISTVFPVPGVPARFHDGPIASGTLYLYVNSPPPNGYAANMPEGSFPQEIEAMVYMDTSGTLDIQSTDYTNTVITNTIGTSGRDYSTITAWEAATTYNLITSGHVRVGECYNDSPFKENITFAGGVSDSTCYRKLTIASGAYHYHNGDTYQGVNVSGFISITDPYFYLEKIRIHREEPVSGTIGVLRMSGSGSFCTIHKVIVHDVVASGTGFDLRGIYANSVGGIKILDCIVYQLQKINTDADTGSGGSIVILAPTTTDSYVYNCLAYNFHTDGWFTFTDGTVCVFGPNSNKVHVRNTLSLTNGYSDDHSSYVPWTANVYRFDFTSGWAADSNYNAAMGGGHQNQQSDRYVPGANSLTDLEPRQIFAQPALYTRSSDGFYGYNYNQTPGFSGVWTRTLENSPYYKVQRNETGTITFGRTDSGSGYYIQKQTYVGGYTYVSSGVCGPLSGNSFVTYYGPSVYTYNYNDITHVSGDNLGLKNIDHNIQWDSSLITIDWENILLTPPSPPYVQDPNNPIYISGTLVSGLINLGVEAGYQGGYRTSNITIPARDFRLKNNAIVIGSGIYISGVPELLTDIRGVARPTSGAWDIGPFVYVPFASGIVEGLLFNEGMETVTSSYTSGIMTPFNLNTPTMYIRDMEINADDVYRGLVSVTLQSNISNNWNFYLETLCDDGNYALFTASGHATNQYNIYKELLELRAQRTLIDNLNTPAYIWAQDTTQTYITPKLTVYFRKIP